MKVYFHRKPGRWFYIAIGKWVPFKMLGHGGWVCIRIRWFKRFAIDIPKQRGWRWD